MFLRSIRFFSLGYTFHALRQYYFYVVLFNKLPGQKQSPDENK